MAALANWWAPRPGHEQRHLFQVHEANLHVALAESERLARLQDAAALLQVLGVFAQNTSDLDASVRFFDRLVENRRRAGDKRWEAAAYHQLGMVAQERRDLDAAQRWYEKSVEIKERVGGEHDAATTSRGSNVTSATIHGGTSP